MTAHTFSGLHVVMVAAENGALAGGKIGGVGDVVRDLPRAIARQGGRVTVLTPSYGSLHLRNALARSETVRYSFAGKREEATTYTGTDSVPGVSWVVVDHPAFATPEPGMVYVNDRSDRPFATDANRFARFGCAAAQVICGLSDQPDVLHLHDWHCGPLALLRSFGQDGSLRRLPAVFTIHNLAYQGIRPFGSDESSMERWFPELNYDRGLVTDPRYADCVNLMLAGMRLCDHVNTVSPTYANEIQATSGEGLESTLKNLGDQDLLTGVLNGCEYDVQSIECSWASVVHEARRCANDWRQNSEPQSTQQATHALMASRLANISTQRPEVVCTSVGRVTEQKFAIALAESGNASTVLERILQVLGHRGVIIVLGTGDDHLENTLADIATRNENFIFLNGYSENLANLLYANGDVFLMPSLFEPCGISQLLAMRSSQPCIVHGVGGLSDTVRDDQTGFVFHGDSLQEQAGEFFDAFVRFLDRMGSADWVLMRDAAAAVRFSWDASALSYLQRVYQPAMDRYHSAQVMPENS